MASTDPKGEWFRQGPIMKPGRACVLMPEGAAKPKDKAKAKQKKAQSSSEDDTSDEDSSDTSSSS